jgi:flagellar biogenesis protein FliO
MKIMQVGFLRIIRSLVGRTQAWRSRVPRQLCLRETLPLGDRRFVALVEFEQQKFLIGGAGNSVAMLASLVAAERTQAAKEIPTWIFQGKGELQRIRVIK